MNELLGNQIKSIRVAKHFTQKQVSDQIGVSRQKYARIENGSDNITLELLSRVAKTFDVTIGDITKVLDEVPQLKQDDIKSSKSTKEMFEMIDFFYANKHLYYKLQKENI